jgi:hypothetical protein
MHKGHHQKFKCRVQYDLCRSYNRTVSLFWAKPHCTKTKHVLVNTKVITKTCFSPRFCNYNTNPCPTLSKIIQLKMSSMSPPAASSSLPLSISLWAPPVMPAVAAAAVATPMTTTMVTMAAATMAASEVTVACGGGGSFEFRRR